MSQTQSGQQATVGRLVLYRNAFGMNGVMPAVVAVTADTYVGGAWRSPEDVTNDERYQRDMSSQLSSQAMNLDRDGEFFDRTLMPPVKDGAVHLAVLTPSGSRYEYNVREGDGPGQWSWPPRV